MGEIRVRMKSLEYLKARFGGTLGPGGGLGLGLGFGA